MSVRELKRRIKELERRTQICELIVLTLPNGEKKQLPARPSFFFRAVDALIDPERFAAERVGGVRYMTENYLDIVRRATQIEGPSAQLYGLLQALALGPVETPNTKGEA